MNDTNRTILVTLVGAAVGGVVGYLFFTERGRTVRNQLEPAVDRFAGEISRSWTTALRAATLAEEGWHLMNQAVTRIRAREESRMAGSYPPVQSQPF